VFGGAATDDFRLAMVLTALWLGAAGLASLLTGLRWRQLVLPVLGTYIVVARVIGGYLAVSTFRDRVVHEQVVVASPVTGAVEFARGSFVSQAHETTGKAAVVELADGSRVLTLTGFETDPGPDLRAYLVPGTGESDAGAVDLGGLKGNRGDQQDAIPPEVGDDALGGVTVWCRALSVNFGYATLERA
jgi:hypothetical protein